MVGFWEVDKVNLTVRCHWCGKPIKLTYEELTKITLEDMLVSLPICTDACADEFLENFHGTCVHVLNSQR